MRKGFFWNGKNGVRWIPLEIWTMVKYNGIGKRQRRL
jgi:hypothetical protein